MNTIYDWRAKPTFGNKSSRLPSNLVRKSASSAKELASYWWLSPN